jgi:HEAT repeat protein
LGSYAAYVSEATRDSLRSKAVKAWGRALKLTPDAGNKIFLIEQLRLFGNNAAVPLLKPYLLHERFCDPAIRALSQIKTSAALVAMEAALDKAKGHSEISLVKALGDLHYLGAEQGITLRTKSEDPLLRRAALFALAGIASEDSEPVLAAAAEKVNFGYDVTGATAAYLLFAANLGHNWPTAPALTAANNVLKKCKADSLVHIRIAALKIIVDVMGYNATNTLMLAADNKNAAYRAAALVMAAKNMNAANAEIWVQKAERSAGATRAEIIRMLAADKQRSAISLLTKALKDSDLHIRMTAISAAAEMQSAEMLSPLLVAMKTADSTEVRAIGNALLYIRGRDVPGYVAVALQHAPPFAQITLLHVLTQKKAADKEYLIRPLLNSSNKDVVAAAKATLEAVKQ